MRISSLGVRRDEDLYELVPKIVPDCQITLKDQQVWGQPSGATRRTVLFDCDDLSSFTFNQINGKNNLQWIAQAVADYASFPFARAFAYTRGLFLTLVQNRVCLPINNPQLG